MRQLWRIVVPGFSSIFIISSWVGLRLKVLINLFAPISQAVGGGGGGGCFLEPTMNEWMWSKNTARKEIYITASFVSTIGPCFVCSGYRTWLSFSLHILLPDTVLLYELLLKAWKLFTCDQESSPLDETLKSFASWLNLKALFLRRCRLVVRARLLDYHNLTLRVYLQMEVGKHRRFLVRNKTVELQYFPLCTVGTFMTVQKFYVNSFRIRIQGFIFMLTWC